MNVARLRADIDAGKSGDKVPGLDPAAAPLGTDDEAAGIPVPPGLAEEVRAFEATTKPAPNISDGEPDVISDSGVLPSMSTMGWITAGVCGGIILIAGAWALFLR